MDKSKDIPVIANDRTPAKRVIRLEDLDGEIDVVGGAEEKLFFGEQPESISPFSGIFKGPGKGR